jgi:hypothetical protein
LPLNIPVTITPPLNPIVNTGYGYYSFHTPLSAKITPFFQVHILISFIHATAIYQSPLSLGINLISNISYFVNLPLAINAELLFFGSLRAFNAYSKSYIANV